MDQVYRPHAKLLIVIGLTAALYWLAMLVGTHWPLAPQLKERQSSFDKIEHLVAFAGLALLLCSAGAAVARPTWRLYLVVLAIAALYGAFDELSQAWAPGRTSDFRDWAADMLGASVGIGCFLLVRWIVLRAKRAPESLTPT